MKSSRRVLKSFASGLANQFTASANYYAWQALHYSITKVTIDVLNIAVAPVEFDIPRNRKLVELCLGNLALSMQRHNLRESVHAIELIAEFDVQNAFADRFGTCVPMMVTATIIDDRGKSWIVALAEEGKLAQG